MMGEIAFNSSAWESEMNVSSTNITASGSDYEFHTPEAPYSDAFVTPRIVQLCGALGAKKVLELGCGNGSMMVALHQAGFQVSGCDPSESGVEYARQVLKPGGHLIVSTPFHGYLKNLLLSLANKWDWHHSPLWDGGHVKFWSKIRFPSCLRKKALSWRSLSALAVVPAFG